MTRRELFLGTAALALVPLAANASEMLEYAPGDMVTVLLLRKPTKSDKNDGSLKVELELISR